MSEQPNVISAPAHEVIIVPDYGTPGREVLKQQCIDVRIRVFAHEQGFPLETEIDEFRTALFEHFYHLSLPFYFHHSLRFHALVRGCLLRLTDN